MKFDASFVYGVSDAVKKLRPKAQFELTNTQFTQWWDPSGAKPPSWDEIMVQVQEDERIYNSLQYARDRAVAFPKVEEQLDMIYHAIKDGVSLDKSEWFTTIKEIKEKYPKP